MELSELSEKENKSSYVGILIGCCLFTAFLSGGASWVASQSSSGQTLGAAVAANTAQIVSMQGQITAMREDLKTVNDTMPGRFVSAEAFTEYKRAADAQAAQTHDFQVRIDTKMDTLLAEHAKQPGRNR